jgi:hypothetical protein
MAAIGSSWALDEEIEVPEVLYDAFKAMDYQPGALSSIPLETTEGDPSETRDITDPIYKGCWWRGEVPVGSGTAYGELTRLFRVRRHTSSVVAPFYIHCLSVRIQEFAKRVNQQRTETGKRYCVALGIPTELDCRRAATVGNEAPDFGTDAD